MGWQEYIVGAIGLIAAALIVRRAVCFFRGRRRAGCDTCDSAGCPLREFKKRR